MADILVKKAIENYSTPFYLFDLDEAKNRALFLKNYFKDQANICFAMKANPFLAHSFLDWIDKIEVCSMGEFEICQKQGIPAQKLLISGVLKKEKDLSKIVESCGNSCLYTVESLSQLKCLAKLSEKYNTKLNIYLRLTSGNQFGMDEGTIEDIIATGYAYPMLYISGIHYFSGTQKKSSSKYRQELEYLDDYICKLEEKCKYKILNLEYGPGLAVPYFEGQQDNTKEDMEAILDALSKRKWQGQVTLEMGRALAATCGYYMTSICDIKQSKGKSYCIVDGGIHQVNYDGQIRGMYPVKCHLEANAAKMQESQWTICGSLCTVNDVLLQKIDLKDPKPGDVLVFENAGAYAMTEGMALFLSHELPEIVTYCRKDGFTSLRPATQTFTFNTERI